MCVHALLQVLLVFTLARYEGPSYGDYHYSTGAIVLGWAVASVSFVPIPVYAIVQLFMASGSFTEVWRQTHTEAHRQTDGYRYRQTYRHRKAERDRQTDW